MYEPKTKVNNASVKKFLNGVPDEKKRNDSFILLEMMRKATGKEPKMWGTNIVGFDLYHHKGKSTEGDWGIAGFSPRKRNLTLYMMSGWVYHKDLLKRLGKHSLGKVCLYINRLDDVDLDVLQDLIDDAFKRSKNLIKKLYS
jgi:hypothetical protein